MKKYFYYGIIFISVLFLIRCEKDENEDLIKTVFYNNTTPILTTDSVSQITDTSAFAGGIITNDGGTKIIATGVCWSTVPEPTINDAHSIDRIPKRNFTSKISPLTPGLYYFVRAYATNSKGTAYGNQISFTTKAVGPSIITSSVNNITSTTATSGGNIISDGGAIITARGICYDTILNPTLSNTHTSDGTGSGNFTSNITSLTPGITYHVRAYAVNSIDTAYGNDLYFITLNLPTVTTTSISNISLTGANSGGNISSDGGAAITARGVCWSISQNPTISNSHTSDGSGNGSFSSSITGLTANTTFYVRAYATNSAGTAYGTQRSFTTLNIPAITTTTISNITSNSAISGGNISSDGGTTVTAFGVCWSSNTNPTISNSHTIDGTGIGSFTSSISNLTIGTTYYVRAYATNIIGTSYGTQRSFTTLNIPTIITTSINNITSTTASCGGNVTSDGGITVTARGVCWSTSQNPTINDTHTSDGTGTGTFTSSITALTPGTTYYVRTYATNSIGTIYGTQLNFTTLNIPAITTTTISNITSTTASSGGNVISDGGTTVTSRGVCWSTSQNPTINDTHTSDGTGTGTFTSSITALTPGTTYYVRTYATNSIGTIYGTQLNFTTLNLPSIATTTISNITSTNASCGGNVTSDGGTTVTARGVCWSTTTNPTLSNSHTSDGTGTGSFTSNITGLMGSTTYYVRAYATNSVGTVYGAQLNFTTLNLPAVTTSSIINITSNTASCGGNVTTDGGATVTARGVCWSTTQNPTISNTHTSDGAGIGSFASSISGLAIGTTYYVRAYATNSVGTNYGTQISFTTLNLPAVTTSSIINITSTTASCGGNVTTDGGATVTARGVCWNTTQNPTISNTHTSDGAGIGSFASSISGLTIGTTYYVRAYATNIVGTNYGTQISFTTLNLPAVTTSSISNINAATATGGGIIITDGGTTVTASGVCWSTTQNPTISNSHTSDGTNIGTFTSLLNGLSDITIYYVRAYATNSVGTAYGNQISFNSGRLFGSTYGGGLVFYNDGSGHGLVCAPTNQSTGAIWGCYGTAIGGTSTTINTGAANTNVIIAGCTTAGIAAKLCYDLVLNTYSDWYLPSKDELNLMYLNLHTQSLGNFANGGIYWSSSEDSGYTAWERSFSLGGGGIGSKGASCYVRAVRTF